MFRDYFEETGEELDLKMMEQALLQAVRAADDGEVPVGAVISCDREIIAVAWNQRETLQDPTAHAEIMAISRAAEVMGSWRLTGCSLYVTLEPCAMCAGAIVLARLDRLIYGADDPKAGACGSVLDVIGCPNLNHSPEVIRHLLKEPCGAILKDFFQQRRTQKNSESQQNPSQDPIIKIPRSIYFE